MNDRTKLDEFENLFYYFSVETLEQMGRDLLKLIHDEPDHRSRMHYAQVFIRVSNVLVEKGCHTVLKESNQ